MIQFILTVAISSTITTAIMLGFCRLLGWI